MNQEKKKQLNGNEDTSVNPSEAQETHCYVKGKVNPGHTAPVVDLHLEFADTSFNEKLKRLVAQAELAHTDEETNKDKA